MTATRPIGAAALALIAALTLTWATATAQEPTVASTVTTLHPGANLVGWVGETAPVSQLFRDIPQLETVWAWDAELDEWIVAGRSVPEGLGWLWQVSPGMGLYMILNGDQPFRWQRSTEPTRGLVELRTGWNLVAWSGANETPIDDATKGIGWSLREVRRHNAETQQWTAWTSPERTAQLIATTTNQSEETPTIQRGEALWVNVARAVRWLQPTDILPRLVFPGGASDELQARVREDLESVLAFFRTQYGIQAEPDFTVYIPKDVDSLIQSQKDNGEEIDSAWEAAIRALWTNAEAWWRGKNFAVKQASWLKDSAEEITARYSLTHEYFHILQRQMSDGWASEWLIEGTATWAEGEHQMVDSRQTLQALREQMYSVLSSYAHAPTLRSTEIDNSLWEYTLGWLATDQLTATAGSDSWVEFWRRLATTEIDSHRRWTSRPDWQAAFNETFGFPVSGFYAKFNAWQHEQAAANEAPTNSYDDDVRRISGRVMDVNDTPISGAFVNAIRVEGGTGVGWNQRAETDDHGAYAVRVSSGGDYHLSVDINECRLFYSNGELTDDWDRVQPVVATGSETARIDFRVPSDFCGWFIRGRVVDDAGNPLSGVFIRACPIRSSIESATCSQGDSTASDGSFTVVPPTVGEYHLSLNLAGDCTGYWHSSGRLTPDRGKATPIEIVDNDIVSLQLYVPSELCRQRVKGSIEGIERFLNGDGRVVVVLCQMGKCVTEWLDRDGQFALVAPTAGSYHLHYGLNGCALYHSSAGLTSDKAAAMRIDIGDRDVRVGHRRVPASMCAYQISGTAIGNDGAPLGETWVLACEKVDGKCLSGFWGLADADGAFTITVPTDGAYSLDVELRRQPYCLHDFAGQTPGSPNNPVRVSGADVTGITLRLPGTIEDLCN